MSFGANLKYLRLRAGLTQEELADKIGVKKQAISRYENSDRQPNIRTANRIAEVFGVTLESMAKTNNPVTRGDGVEEKGQPLFSDNQRKLIDLFPEMTDSEISVLLATAQAQISSRKHRDDG